MVLKSQLADNVYTCTHTYVLSRVQLCVTPWTVSRQYSGNASDFQLSTIGLQSLSSAFCILAQIALPNLFFKNSGIE